MSHPNGAALADPRDPQSTVTKISKLSPADLVVSPETAHHPISITTGGKDRVPSAVALYAAVFATDPLINYLLNSIPKEARLAYLPSYFNSLLTAATLNRAYISEANSWQSCGVIMPPGTDVGNPLTLLQSGLLSVVWKLGLDGVRKMLIEFEGAVKAARKQGLRRGEEAYYVFFVGTAEEWRNKGRCSALVRECMDRAAGEGRSVWLEATTEASRRVYAALGFVEVKPLVFGKGKVGKGGEAESGGEGVTIWAMVWRKEEGVEGKGAQ